MKQQHRVLFITATRAERESLQSLVGDLSAKVQFVDSPEEAAQKMESDPYFDVVFVGIESPQDKNCRVLDSVRGKNPRTAVVFLSRIDDVGFYLDCMQRGVFDYIPRPVDWKEFRRIYQLALRGHSSPNHTASRAA